MKENWKMFFTNHWPKLWRLMLPKVCDWDKDFYGMHKYWRDAGAIALYDPHNNIILVSERGRSWPILAHEYGHWLFNRAHLWLDSAWEIPWWLFGLRSLFIRKGGGPHEEPK